MQNRKKIEFKLKLINEYLSGETSYRMLAKKYNIKHHQTIAKWVNSYKINGIDSLIHCEIKKHYSLDFKLDVVNLYLTRKMSYQDIANHFKLNHPDIAANWIKKYLEKGVDGLVSRQKGILKTMSSPSKKSTNNKKAKKELTPEQKRIKELEEINLRLEIQNEFLKKKIALKMKKRLEKK